MFKYTLKTKIIFIFIFAILIAGLVFLVNFNKSRSRDLQLVSQIKTLATGLELYYYKFDAYPISEQKVSLDQIRYISNKGMNQEGSVYYFRRNFDWAGEATYTAIKDDYAIDFDLERSWPTWGLTSYGGGKCRIAKNVYMKCVPE